MTQKLSNLIAKYNRNGNTLLISEYAPLGKGSTGLSRYSKTTAQSLGGQKIVLANIIHRGIEAREEENTLVIRCFQRNNVLSYLNLIYFASKFDEVNKVLFEFEFASYGAEKISAIVPLLLLALRLLGKNVTFVLHQVVMNIKELHVHLGLRQGSPYLGFLQKAILAFYFLVGLLSSRVVVLEEELRRRLSLVVDPKKIIVIPHGIETLARDNVAPREKDFIILCFGYVTWYKGIDRLIRAFNGLPTKIAGRRLRLIIAGGRSVAQVGKAHYESYYQEIMKLARKNSRVNLPGFIAESEIGKYYRAADLCVLPYREFISSSGPLSLAISFRKPLLLSEDLKPYLLSTDFRESLVGSGLDSGELFTKITTSNLEKAVRRVIADGSYQDKMFDFEENLASVRSWLKLGAKYETVFSEGGEKLYVRYFSNRNNAESSFNVTS